MAVGNHVSKTLCLFWSRMAQLNEPLMNVAWNDSVVNYLLVNISNHVVWYNGFIRRHCRATSIISTTRIVATASGMEALVLSIVLSCQEATRPLFYPLSSVPMIWEAFVAELRKKEKKKKRKEKKKEKKRKKKDIDPVLSFLYWSWIWHRRNLTERSTIPVCPSVADNIQGTRKSVFKKINIFSKKTRPERCLLSWWRNKKPKPNLARKPCS